MLDSLTTNTLGFALKLNNRINYTMYKKQKSYRADGDVTLVRFG